MKKLILFFVIVLGVAEGTYLRDLEEQGYCVIPGVLSDGESRVMYERVWHEFIEKAWPACQMNDRSNWNEAFPIFTRAGVFAGAVGQTQVMWDLRQDLRVVDVFKGVWGTDQLIVSMDGMSIMCPVEVRKGFCDPWPHVDQKMMRRQDAVTHDNNPPEGFVSESSLSTKPFTIQGQFLFEESCEGDGGFYCILKSHLRFKEFAPELESISAENPNAAKTYLLDFFEGDCFKHITAPRGSVILWDSRTVHWNQHPKEARDDPKVRMVGYICYVPKSRLTDEGKALRREAFETGASTGHNASFPEIKRTKDHIREEFKHYIESQSYIQPKIHLTPLGEAILGIE